MKKIWLAMAAVLFSTVVIFTLPTTGFAQSSEGEVTDIDLETGKIKLKHNGIKNLDIPAMKMSFRVSDATWLKKIQVGDKVKFDADKIGSQFTVTALTVDKP